MKTTLRIAVRGLMLLALLAALPAVVDLGGSVESPYLSALSQIPNAYGQVECNNKGCVSGGHRHSNCGRLDGFYCYKYQGSSCSTGQC